jgi:DNA modification methylase
VRDASNDIDRDESSTLIPFDFAFTSPPYYDFEIYEGTEADIKKGYQEWLDDMYIQYLKDMVHLVKPGGYVMVSTSNIYGANIGDDTKRILEDAGAEFVETCMFIHNYTNSYGILYPGTPRPLYVFKKIKGN